MDTLLSASSVGGNLAQYSTTSALKSSGMRTPAPTTKVLRWKDLEATATASAMTDRRDNMSTRSIFGTEEGEQDLFYDGNLWEGERFDSEELFV